MENLNDVAYLDESALVSTDPFDEDADGLSWREANLPHGRRAFDALLALDRELEQTTAEAQRRIAELEHLLALEREWVEAETAKQAGARSFYELRLRAYAEREAARTGCKTVDFPNGSFSLRAQQPEWRYPTTMADEYGYMIDALKAADLVHEVVAYAPDKRAIKDVATVTPSGSVYLPGQEEPLPGVTVVERVDAFSYQGR